MPHSSNILVGGDSGAVKAEPADEGGVVPFLDCGQTIRSVSPPGLSHTPKRNNDDGGGNNDDQSNGTAHAIAPAMSMRQPDIPRSSDANGDGNNTKKGNDILLSLKDEKYKGIYTKFCEKLWGKNRDESLTPKDVAQGMLDNLKVAVKRSGGKLYRGSTGGNTSHPLDTEALKKIKADLQRAKVEWNGSILYNRERGKVAKKDGTTKANTVQPTKMPPAPTNDKDLVLSLNHSKYKKIINECVKASVTGECKQTYSEMASMQIGKVLLNGGGKIYGSEYDEVDFDDAVKKMTKCIRKEVAKARKKHTEIIILNMESNGKYEKALDAIRSKGDTTGSSSKQISRALYEQFKENGIKYFFMSAGEQKKMSREDAVDQIFQDVNSKFTFVSSTRKRKQHCDKYPPILGQIMQKYLVNDGWEVKTDKKKELDVLVATKGLRNLTGGYEDIIEEAYLGGVYDKELEGMATNDKEWLKQAGIDVDVDPYSVFEEALKQKRKRRKHIDQVVDGGDIGGEENINEGKDNASPSSHASANVAIIQPEANDDNGFHGGKKESDPETPTKVSATSATVLNSEQGTNTSQSGPKNDVSFASTSTGMKQVLELLKHTKAKLSKSSNKKEESRKLQIQFYSHIKSWLAPRVSRVVENELSDVLGRIDTFDSAIEELEAPECDEELTRGFTTLCENIIKSCKKDFPLKNLN